MSRAPIPPIRKRIVTDEARHPVAVQLDYADWLRIEPILREKGLLKATEADPLEALADAVRPYWQGGEGLAYQKKLRDEWEDRT